MSTKNTPPLRIIGLTQGANIDIFLSCIQQIKDMGQAVDKVGAVVSLAAHYRSSKTVKDLGQDIPTIKEWEIVQQALDAAETQDLSALRKVEDKLSAASIWKAIIGDRRLIYGRRAKFTQDYRVHFTDQQLWSIAGHFIQAFEDMLDDIKPDVILGFTPVTFGELLALEIAHSRGIPTLQLHSSRIKNYFALHDTVYGTSRHFHKLMEKGGFKDETTQIAKSIIDETCKKGLIYEGANKSIAQGRRFDFVKIVKTAPKVFVKEILKALDPVTRHDHHDPGHIIPWLYVQILQPLKERIIKARLGNHKRVIQSDKLDRFGAYCFFPLQSEPEVSIQVMGRPYHKNQIELLRNLAASLPAGMKLLVKEHPRSLGLRPFSYYKELFNIPNLYIADLHAPSMPMVNQSEFVAVISGTIGLEAIMAEKPVLILGHPKYEDMPGQMTQKCYNLFELPDAIRNLLKTYRYDRNEIVTFLSALIEGSVAIDLYSSLLLKPGRHSFQGDEVSSDDNIRSLADYILKRVDEVKNEHGG